jgi:hypothetical protein
MKKTLLSMGLALAAWTTQGQVTTTVLQPADLAGPVDFTWADGWGMTPDLNDPANAIQAFGVFADDGTDDDSLACNALVNGSEIAGKIAVLYRGVCEFGAKALNCQDAGAIGVVIVNNAPGAPIAIGAGAVGASVSIPVVMITQEEGAILHDEIAAGNVEFFIGSVQGLFTNNLAITKSDMLLPRASAMPALVASNASEFSVDLGSWIHNYGNAEQTGVSLHATVTHDGSTLYDETSDPATIPVGDTLFFALPAFSQSSYSGLYEIIYTVDYGNTDDFPDDNSFTANFSIDSLLAFGRINETTGLPEQEAFYQPSGVAQLFQSCVQFQDPNGSRLRAEGMYVAATHGAPGTMTGQELTTHLYEWNDDVTGVSDATFDALSELINGEYAYADSLEDGLPVYIPFFEPTILEDNQRYLFCVSTSDPEVFIGHCTSLDYDENYTNADYPTYDQFTTILNTDGTWYPLGFGTETSTAIAVKMGSATAGIEEQNVIDVTPYPNPTSKYLRIPVKGLHGTAQMAIFNTEGDKVSEQQVNVSGNHTLTVDIQDLGSGTYLFHMEFENGQRSDFRVVVTK